MVRSLFVPLQKFHRWEAVAAASEGEGPSVDKSEPLVLCGCGQGCPAPCPCGSRVSAHLTRCTCFLSFPAWVTAKGRVTSSQDCLKEAQGFPVALLWAFMANALRIAKSSGTSPLSSPCLFFGIFFFPPKTWTRLGLGSAGISTVTGSVSILSWRGDPLPWPGGGEDVETGDGSGRDMES